MTVSASFSSLLTDIEPSSTTKKNAASAHEAFRAHIASSKKFKALHQSDFLSGSYKRDTAIRPRKKGESVDRPDIDVVCVANLNQSTPPADVFSDFKEAVKEKYGGQFRFDSRSVSISTSIADMDAIVVIQPVENGFYYLPDKGLGQWVMTGPDRHTTWSTQQNKRLGSRFKPLVKLIKWWRRENATISKNPKGILLEALCAECAPSDVTDYPTLFAWTLRNIADAFEMIVDQGHVPFVADPAGTGQNLTDDLSVAAFKGFVKKAREHSDAAGKVLDGGYSDAEIATDEWRKILGDRFPKVVGGEIKKSRSAGLMDAAVGVPVASFPNKAITPRKPRGFAEA